MITLLRTPIFSGGYVMKKCQLIRSLVLVGTCLLLASCIDSKTPLTSPEQAKIDPKLAGLWRAEMEDGRVEYYHAAPADNKLPAGVLRLVSVSYNKTGSLSRPGELLAFSSSVNGNKYLNVALIDGKDLDQFANAGWKPELVKGYIVAKYQVQGDTLTLWGMDRDAKRRAIKAGKIKGTVDENNVFFTDTPEHLAAMLAGPENAHLFDKEPIRYERVK